MWKCYLLILIFALLVVPGCGPSKLEILQQKVHDQRLMSDPGHARAYKEGNTQIYCTAGDDCETKWGRAVFYASKYNRCGIQTQTDTLIMSAGSRPGSRNCYGPFAPAVMYHISKLLIGEGKYEIRADIRCGGSVQDCEVDPVRAKAGLVVYIAEGRMRSND